ncbi:MAG: PD-(D/E)XK nuclease family protein [Casimicrobium sp.]
MTRDLNSSVQLAEPHNEEASELLYVCPSDRAARAWRVRLAQHRVGVAIPVCTHVEAWMAELWSRAQIFELLGDARTLLEPVIASALWQYAAREVTDLAAPECVRVAQLAEDAWQLSHRHFFSSAQLSAYAETDENIALYVRISARVRQILSRNQCVTRAELPALIAANASAIAPLLPAGIVLTPSFSSDPALQKLWESLRGIGVRVSEVALREPDAAPTTVTACPDTATEMRHAIDWAAQQLAEHAEASVALIVPNLAANRDSWLRALRERFNPNEWWRDPATDRAHFNLSAGEALADFPYVHSALTLLRAATQALDTELIAQALMHPRWAQDSRWQYQVGRTQQRLLDRGMDRTRLIEWSDVLPEPLQAWLSVAEQDAQNARTTRQTHRESIEAFVAALTGAAWLPRTDLFQLDEAWINAQDRWLSLDAILGPVTWAAALAELQRISSAMTFQPKAGTARLQVMGLLESAGVPIDVARIVGFDETVLPERAKPNPMLPRVWQATNSVGLGSQDEADARGQRLWRNWQSLCGSLSISWATEAEGRAIAVSPIARDLSVCTVSAASSPSLRSVRTDSADDFTRLALVRDESLPPRKTAAQSKPLTARALEEQAQCPRRAAASRLGLRAWPEYAIGIPARVRGTLVHAVLAAVGQLRKVAFAAELDSPDDNAMMVAASDALDAAIEAEKALRKRVPESIWAIEHDRILKLVRQVIALEKTRTGFAVVEVETELRASTFGQDFRVRLDRVDESAEATATEAVRVVFDYKTGAATRGDWFAERTSGRLAAPQLPLYAVLLSQHETEHDAEAPPVRALGYIMVTDDDVKYVGVGEDAALYKASVAKNDPPWETLLDGWYAQLGVLVDEAQSGVADVAPLKGQSTCRNCDVAAFCREPWSLAGEDGGEGDGDGLDGAAEGAGNE